jgi:uncharacterized protein (UPF0276 family)
MHVGVSLMLDEAFRATATPLFESGVVDVLEYSFELGWARERPAWAEALLEFYGSQGRLWGHGVTYSPFSADAESRHADWLERVAEDCGALQLRGVSEHYGFMGLDGADVGAPLPLPPMPDVADVGARALRRVAKRCGVPVGLENLAMALSPDDVMSQPSTITEVLECVDGYLVLDLHNLWCQAVNFDRDPVALMECYPLERAAVLHVSGGSWSMHGESRLRRDTHDARVPEDVFALVPEALARCPRLEVAILEQLGPTLADSALSEGYQRDFLRLKEVCA